jgi:hypothetical protein
LCYNKDDNVWVVEFSYYIWFIKTLRRVTH